MNESQLQGSVDPELIEESSWFKAKIVEEHLAGPGETPPDLKNPFFLDVTRFNPNERPLDPIGFIELTGEIITLAQRGEENPISFTNEYPDMNLSEFGTEVITWKLLSRQPASTARTGGTRLPQWQHSYDTVSPEDSNKIVTTEMRMVDNLIEFKVWSTIARTADARILWLERLLIDNTWAYQEKGADLFQWRTRGPDTYTTSNGVKLFYRYLQFDVRLLEFRIKTDPTIRSVNVQAHTLGV